MFLNVNQSPREYNGPFGNPLSSARLAPVWFSVESDLSESHTGADHY